LPDHDLSPGPLWAEVRGSGPPVVLLHGQPGSRRDWSAVVPLLTGTCTAIVVDRPGYGRSPGPAAGYEGNALAVAATLDRLGVDRAVVVGHSWAGGVALTLATRHPERVAGLVLVSSVGPTSRPGAVDRLLGAPAVGDALVASTFFAVHALLGRPAVRRNLARLLPASGRATLEVVTGGARPEEIAAVDPNPWRSFLHEQREFNDGGAGGLGAVTGDLDRVAAPCTVLTGTGDHIVDPSVAADLAAAIPGARLVRIPDAGHLLPFDHPGEVAEAIRLVLAGA
jgi:pimeloyl-ACP methyl ester carboxylesterase